MSEVTFARQFLSALDTRPIKLSSDHVADPRSYPAQGAYTLPKQPNQTMKRKRAPPSTAPGAQKAGPTVSISLKNSKSPCSSLNMESQALTTSIYDLKAAYAAKSGGSTDKIKLLYNKKPTQDSKTLKDVLGEAAETAKEVEFSVMVMGGGAAAVSSPPIETPQPEMAAPPAQGTTGKDVLKTNEFWEDLQGFLQQRLRDESEAANLTTLFKSSWEKS
ncbi:hypothetical protein EJ08DRAFT_243133 [Tothia fuscella]|uniref:Ubiquitin-like domain-containing protein n=1 Tax=Tothia fuscella TaxID=1048955 RepID=A0A9P4NSD6_9PEZI|nr:hypothetical protein EJ08DRAFT_243133 [Tothia fuscella]